MDTEYADRITGLYERHAARYDADRSRKLVIERGWLDRFMALLSAPATVLDIGCGHGEPIARYLIESGYAVTGVDTSTTFVTLCRQRFPENEWHLADMRGLALGRRFGGLLAWDSFFHLTPDAQRQMFSVFASHAGPGAPLMFTSGTSSGVAMGTYGGEPLYHASLEPAEYSQLLESNGFVVRDYVAEDPDCGRHTVWLAQMGA